MQQSQESQESIVESLDEDHLQMLVQHAYDTDTVRAMEQPLLEQGEPLMRHAAAAVATNVLQLLESFDLDEHARITVLAGAGDNGGDGLFAGALLAKRGFPVTAIAVGRTLHDDAYRTFIESGGHIWVLDAANTIPGCPSEFSAGEAGERFEQAMEFASNSHIIIDAMTGIGAQGALRGIAGSVAQTLGALLDELRAHDSNDDMQRPYVVAVDTPSGIGVNDGSLPGPYIPADMTLMFGAMKPCAILPPACSACGEIWLVDFGFDLESHDPAGSIVGMDLAAAAIRQVMPTDAKYSRGVTGLITGSQQYPGAAVLSTTAAAHTNIGMVRYMGPTRAQDLVLHALPEAVIGKGHVQSWVVGSGVPVRTAEEEADLQQQSIEALLAHYALSEDGSNEEAYAMPAIVVDAGALDLLPDHVPSHVVLTPHMGELTRLLTRLGVDVDEDTVRNQPLQYARMAAKMTGATVLLKGSLTIVVQGGQFADDQVFVAGRAPAQLATAGAGDVLAGMLGAILAQNADLVQPSVPSGDESDHDDEAQVAQAIAEIAGAAAYLHGLAAALASKAKQRGWHRAHLFGIDDLDEEHFPIGRPIVASDVVKKIAAAIGKLQNN
ncbi:bifunctional ADP-dependent NAD(P)H-hydrate dehydratase/NAD(P)H-hydrate epimerase [Bifidobacterium dolichotidis]|nr:bifunctional ADP-dependent NAD(P)H-hydrate dehydratase/NAD(P)H-hydrate epimerase [Bifidobacterium dolichotidis]